MMLTVVLLWYPFNPCSSMDTHTPSAHKDIPLRANSLIIWIGLVICVVISVPAGSEVVLEDEGIGLVGGGGGLQLLFTDSFLVSDSQSPHGVRAGQGWLTLLNGSGSTGIEHKGPSEPAHTRTD